MTAPTLATGILTRITHSVIFYPISVVYGCAAALAAAVASHRMRLDVGVVLLTLIVVATLLVSTRREVALVHSLVNSQRDDLVATVQQMGGRIDQLTAALVDAGVAVPRDESKGWRA